MTMRLTIEKRPLNITISWKGDQTCIGKGRDYRWLWGICNVNFYKRLLEEFASESERNYPHIIMDNNFTMPSRTRALLYGEAYDEVVDGISDSIQLMMQNDVSKIILVCGTAHYFLMMYIKKFRRQKKNCRHY